MEQTADRSRNTGVEFRAEDAVPFLKALIDSSDDITAILDPEKRLFSFEEGSPADSAFYFNSDLIPVLGKEGKCLGYIVKKRERTSSGRDYLTGTAARSCLDREFFLQNTNRSPNTELVLVFIDLNHFKPVNERYGHLAGDQVLRQFAVLLKNSFRDSDCVARYGGDEFAVLCCCPLEIVQKRVEEFQKHLAGRCIEVTIPGSASEREEIALGFSYGITQVFPNDTFSTALERADRTLLKMKREYR